MRAFLSLVTPIHPEGYRFIMIFAGATFVLFLFSNMLGWAGVVLTVWCAFFFRDPARHVPQRDGLVISPADGVVNMISEATPPPELGLGIATRPRVSIFMNVFNCHVNRLPHSGKITKSAYRTGRFLNADMDKASEANERQSLLVELPDGRDMVVVQIAGLVARRIMCWAEEGDELQTGERFGLIRFGSRLDVYLPEGTEPLVTLGQTAIAGETVLADFESDEPAREAELI
jgi:phosphatidylserine decarboxylase